MHIGVRGGLFGVFKHPFEWKTGIMGCLNTLPPLDPKNDFKNDLFIYFCLLVRKVGDVQGYPYTYWMPVSPLRYIAGIMQLVR